MNLLIRSSTEQIFTSHYYYDYIRNRSELELKRLMPADIVDLETQVFLDEQKINKDTVK